MLEIAVSSAKEFQKSRAPIALFAFESGPLAGAELFSERVRKDLLARAAGEGFKGKAGEVASFLAAGGGTQRRFLIAGLGKKKDCGGETVRKSAAALYQAAKKRFKSIWLCPVSDVGAAAEGLLMASHSFTKYKKTDSDIQLAEVMVPAQKAAPKNKLQKGLEKAVLLAEAVCAARDLVNEGPSDKSPENLTKLAKNIAKNSPGLTLKIIDKAAAKKLGMGAFLGVARGSAQAPYFLHIIYRPKGKINKRVALIGKGVTFDSGGLSLKPAAHMDTMKMDMAGAGAVLGVFQVISRLKPRAEVHGITPLTYNMPGPDALKPGDVLKAMNGKTIEVLNTDAEGRLILADALVYAGRQKCDLMIDLATLTGAAVVALGGKISAAMTNNPAALRAVLAAAKKADEPIWELPLHKEYKADIKSKIADIRNIGKRGEAGTVVAGLFLEEFVDAVPWIHLDIAGPAWAESGGGYCPPGGTGAMVRTLLEYLQGL